METGKRTDSVDFQRFRWGGVAEFIIFPSCTEKGREGGSLIFASLISLSGAWGR